VRILTIQEWVLILSSLSAYANTFFDRRKLHVAGTIESICVTQRRCTASPMSPFLLVGNPMLKHALAAPQRLFQVLSKAALLPIPT
jgi:hypothetical protein